MTDKWEEWAVIIFWHWWIQEAANGSVNALRMFFEHKSKRNWSVRKKKSSSMSHVEQEVNWHLQLISSINAVKQSVMSASTNSLQQQSFLAWHKHLYVTVMKLAQSCTVPILKHWTWYKFRLFNGSCEFSREKWLQGYSCYSPEQYLLLLWIMRLWLFGALCEYCYS